MLLANTNNADAGFVTGRIKDAGYSYEMIDGDVDGGAYGCLLYTSPSPRD